MKNRTAHTRKNRTANSQQPNKPRHTGHDGRQPQHTVARNPIATRPHTAASHHVH